VAAFVQASADLDDEQALRLARMSGGAPGRALALAAGHALALDDAARDLLHALPQVDESVALALADKFRGGEGAAQFQMLFERLSERVHGLAAARAHDEGAALDRWAAAWETLQRLPREVEALNLDRADALFTALAELRAAAHA
jgi:DNA polymerase-3 subunit delta'